MLASDSADSSAQKAQRPDLAVRKPWRSGTVAISTQLPVLGAAYLFELALAMVIIQIMIAAVLGALLILVELVSINRWGLSPITEPRRAVEH